MRDLGGANAIVTGASRGLGVLIAEALADEGVNLVLAARSAEGLDKVRADIANKGVKVVSVPTDVGERSQLETLVDRTEAELGPIDILVNNAGIGDMHPYEEYPPDEIEKLIRINLLAPMLLTRLVLPRMIERDRGHIVQVASMAGKAGFPSQVPYAASKAGLVMMTHTLRAELLGTNVGCSAVCPGFVAGEGMYADWVRDTGQKSSWLLGEPKPGRIPAAVIKAIKRNSSELFVNARPMRPIITLAQVLPDLTPRVLKAFGVTALSRRMVDAYEQSGRAARGSSPPS